MLNDPRLKHLSWWEQAQVHVWWRVRHWFGIHTPTWTVSFDIDESTKTIKRITRRWECGICGVPTP